MKNRQFIYLKIALLLGFIFIVAIGCEREVSDDVEFATFSKTGEIFTDTFIDMGTNFFFPFISDGAKGDVFTVDEKVGFESAASIRIDVPDADDPEGNFAGAIFLIDGAGRNLTEYDALTFWARASQSAAIGAIGFGEGKFLTLRSDVKFTTKWTKYIIPIPDPSMLFDEKGMFLFSAGGIRDEGQEEGQEVGYTFWIDELKFEKLGTIAQPQPAIFFGEDIPEIKVFLGDEDPIKELTQTFNLASGINETVFVAPSYFSFSSSDIEVARVSELGVISIVGTGSAKITATLGGVKAAGSLTIKCLGALPIAPIPMIPAADVKSIYSDAYASVTESDFTPNFGGSTTQTTEAGSDGKHVLVYTNNNYTGIIFNNTVDASTLTHLHIDIFTQQAGTEVEIQVRDIGANGEINTNLQSGLPIEDDKDFRFKATGLAVGGWTSFDIPLGGDIATQKNNLGALILVDGPDFILDNIYFYKE